MSWKKIISSLWGQTLTFKSCSQGTSVFWLLTCENRAGVGSSFHLVRLKLNELHILIAVQTHRLHLPAIRHHFRPVKGYEPEHFPYKILSLCAQISICRRTRFVHANLMLHFIGFWHCFAPTEIRLGQKQSNLRQGSQLVHPV